MPLARRCRSLLGGKTEWLPSSFVCGRQRRAATSTFPNAEKADGTAKAHTRPGTPSLKIVALPPEGASAPTRELSLFGREAWCLNELVRAGIAGITARQFPGARISHYVFCLRGQGLAIETKSEANTGAFAGSHGRYTLQSRVRIIRSTGLGENPQSRQALP